jgi:DNA polymerase I-like protein with 3'-5' exonuclease and polymerase domains
LEADINGVSVYLDDEHIYYINLQHRGPQVSRKWLKTFLQNLLSSDKTIIGHNLKYDLEVIDTFFKKDSHSSTEKQESWNTSQGTLF